MKNTGTHFLEWILAAVRVWRILALGALNSWCWLRLLLRHYFHVLCSGKDPVKLASSCQKDVCVLWLKTLADLWITIFHSAVPTAKSSWRDETLEKPIKVTDHFENTFLFSCSNGSGIARNCWTVGSEIFLAMAFEMFRLWFSLFQVFLTDQGIPPKKKWKTKKNQRRGQISFFFYRQATENAERVGFRQWGFCKASALHSSSHEPGETSHLQAQHREASEEVPERPGALQGPHQEQVRGSAWQQPVPRGLQQPHREYSTWASTFNLLLLLLLGWEAVGIT